VNFGERRERETENMRENSKKNRECGKQSNRIKKEIMSIL